jgi:uncharacterized membrane protein
MQCPACHKEVASPGNEPAAFCNHCGAPLLAAVPAAQSAYTASQSPQSPAAPLPAANYGPPPPLPGAAASPGLSPSAAAALAYITFIPAVIFLVVEPYNKIPLVRFHSFQSIGLFLLWCIVYYPARLLMFPFGFILISMMMGLLDLGFFIVWLICVLKAVKGEYFKLPIIGDIALKQAQS